MASKAAAAGCRLAIPAAAEDAAAFYRGKQVSLVIGHWPGSANDLYGRALTRHMGRHIPGNPTLIAQNMPGAGSVKAANWLYDVAAKDGSVLGRFNLYNIEDHGADPVQVGAE